MRKTWAIIGNILFFAGALLLIGLMLLVAFWQDIFALVYTAIWGGPR